MFSIAFMKKFGGLFLLIALSVIAHWQWLVLPGIFTSGDYGYVSNQIFSESLTAPKILDADISLGNGVSQPTFALLNLIGGLLVKFHMNFAVWERILFLWPIALLSPIPIYLFLLKTLKYPQGAFAGSVIYLFNTYILAREMMHLHIVIAFFLAPLLFIAVRDLLHKQTLRSILFFTAVTTICSIFEIRMLYILMFMLIGYGTYLLLSRKVKLSWKMIRTILYAIIPVALLQSYWLFPFVFANASLGYEAIVSRSLFRSYDHVSEASTLSDPFWSGNQLTDFIPQAVPRWDYFIPLVAFLWIILRPKIRKNSFFWFWGCIAIIGIFLVKQENNPFPHAYSWLFLHFPGFRLFRESSKFNVITAMALAALTAGSLLLLRSRFSRVANALIFGLCVIMLINIIPLVNGSIMTMVTPHIIQDQFRAVNTLLAADATFGRTLWVPSAERFISASQTHPRLSLADLGGTQWLPFLKDQTNPFSITTQPIFKALLNFGSIRYIGEPADQIDNVYQLYDTSKAELGKNIEDTKNLQPIGSAPNDMPVWINPDAKPHAYIADNVVTVHGKPEDFSGIDPSIRTAFVFQPSVSDEVFQHIESTMATNTEYIPFTADSISVGQGAVTSQLKVPESGSFQTTTRNDDKDVIAPIFLVVSDSSLSLIARLPTGDITLSTTPNTHQDYEITINNIHYFYAFNDQSPTTQLGLARLHQSKNSIAFLAKINSDPLIKDPSFEAGTWGDAGDCNNFDNTTKETNGIIASQSSVATDGTHSLQLAAKNHLACTGIVIPSPPTPTTYFGSLDYHQQAGAPGSMKIFQADTMKNISLVQFNEKSDWQHATFSFETDGTHNNTMYLYQPAGQGLFDNIHIDAYQPISSVETDIPTAPQYITSQPYDSTATVLVNPEITGSNLLQQTNFSPGMSFTASDCNNFDSTPTAKNGISASIVETPDHIHALSISAQKHIACITLPLHDFDPVYDYLLSIQYRTLSGSSLHTTFYPNDNVAQATTQLPETNGQWQVKNTIINGSSIHSDAGLIIYAPAENGSAESQFSSLSLTKIPILPSRFIQTANPSLPAISTTEQDINPTLRIVHVSDIGPSPRMLVLSDRFASEWKVFVRQEGSKNLSILQRALFKQPGTEISLNSHIQANAFTNGWIIDPQEIQAKFGSTKNLDLVIEYWPQRYMDIGILASITTLVVYILVLATTALMQWINIKKSTS